MIHRTCCDCGTCKPESQFKVKSGGRVWFNRMCHACKLLRCRAANAACKARKREQTEQPEPRTYVPLVDFLPMGEPDRSVALVSFVEGRVNRNPVSNALEVDPWDRRNAA